MWNTLIIVTIIILIILIIYNKISVYTAVKRAPANEIFKEVSPHIPASAPSTPTPGLPSAVPAPEFPDLTLMKANNSKRSAELATAIKNLNVLSKREYVRASNLTKLQKLLEIERLSRNVFNKQIMQLALAKQHIIYLAGGIDEREGFATKNGGRLVLIKDSNRVKESMSIAAFDSDIAPEPVIREGYTLPNLSFAKTVKITNVADATDAVKTVNVAKPDNAADTTKINDDASLITTVLASVTSAGVKEDVGEYIRARLLETDRLSGLKIKLASIDPLINVAQPFTQSKYPMSFDSLTEFNAHLAHWGQPELTKNRYDQLMADRAKNYKIMINETKQHNAVVIRRTMSTSSRDKKICDLRCRLNLQDIAHAATKNKYIDAELKMYGPNAVNLTSDPFVGGKVVYFVNRASAIKRIKEICDDALKRQLVIASIDNIITSAIAAAVNTDTRLKHISSVVEQMKSIRPSISARCAIKDPVTLTMTIHKKFVNVGAVLTLLP